MTPDIGYLLGLLAPDIYVAVFRLPSDGQIDPLQVGLGLGIGQGLIIGSLIGVLLAAIVAWYDVRTSDNNTGRRDA